MISFTISPKTNTALKYFKSGFSTSGKKGKLIRTITVSTILLFLPNLCKIFMELYFSIRLWLSSVFEITLMQNRRVSCILSYKEWIQEWKYVSL